MAFQPIYSLKRDKGVLLVLDRPSRFDIAAGTLLVGAARDLVTTSLGMQLGEYSVCLPEHMHLFPAAKTIIYAGPRCAELFNQGHLDKLRGYVYEKDGQRKIYTYHPADACDHGPIAEGDDEPAEDTDDYGSTEKDRGVTAWSNYRQWFALDCKKVTAARVAQPVKFTRIYPNQAGCVAWLRRERKYLYVDIECDPRDKTLWCVGIADDVDDTVISLPIYRWDMKALHDLRILVKELYFAMHRSTQVYHNGNFDLSFLFIEYNFPISTNFEDTMCMQHRCYPELEKSLGHTISLWLNEQWHKDGGGTWKPTNKDQYDRLLAYNALDVVKMKACHERMHAEGPASSIAKVNRNARLYLQMGLTGIRVDVLRRIAHKRKLALRLTQYHRILTMLIGYSINCGSSKQLGHYLYTQRGYPIRSKTESGAPATDAKTLYSLLVLHDNAALTVILKIKKDEKSLAMLNAKLVERNV